ncbi:MAG: flagellar FlbD family protein [Acidobacteriota bacterium]
MIKVTRLNNSEILVNPDLIEHIELTADTVVTLTNGSSFVVKESAQEILERIVQFKRRIGSSPMVIERHSA